MIAAISARLLPTVVCCLLALTTAPPRVSRLLRAYEGSGRCSPHADDQSRPSEVQALAQCAGNSQEHEQNDQQK
jgi:hypothetical protein